jgi:hypothetical protein
MGKTIGQQINEYVDIQKTLEPKLDGLRQSLAGLEIELNKALVRQADQILEEQKVNAIANGRPWRPIVQVPINGFKELWRIFKTFVYGLFKLATGEGGKYLVIAIVILLMIYGGMSLAKPSYKPSTVSKSVVDKNKWGTESNPKSEEEYAKLEAARRSNMSKAELAKSQFDDFVGQFSELFDFGYRVSAIQRLFGTFNEPTTARPRFSTGRCNNVDMLETVQSDNKENTAGVYKGTAEGEKPRRTEEMSKCKTVFKPKDIEWEIKTGDLGTDWSELPESIQTDLQDKTTVYIPYQFSADRDAGNMGSFFVPQCDQATYKKRIIENGQVKEVPTPLPMQLLKQNNFVTCKLASHKVGNYNINTNGLPIKTTTDNVEEVVASKDANYSAAFCPL